MIGRFAYTVSEWLVNREAIQKEDQELYEYAVYSLLITIAPLSIAMFFGIIMDVFWQSVILMIPFMTIRKYSGGYHAKNPAICFVTSCLLLLLCIGVSTSVKYNVSVIILMLISGMSLIVNSPIDSENRRLEETEKQRYRHVIVTQTLFYLSVSLGLYSINQPVYALCISIGIILSAGLQIPCLLRQIRNV